MCWWTSPFPFESTRRLFTNQVYTIFSHRELANNNNHIQRICTYLMLWIYSDDYSFRNAMVFVGLRTRNVNSVGFFLTVSLRIRVPPYFQRHWYGLDDASAWVMRSTSAWRSRAEVQQMTTCNWRGGTCAGAWGKLFLSAVLFTSYIV